MNPGSSVGGQKSHPALVDAKPSGHSLSIVHIYLNQGAYPLSEETARTTNKMTIDTRMLGLFCSSGTRCPWHTSLLRPGSVLDIAKTGVMVDLKMLKYVTMVYKK
jgi:hypothetical protein